LSNLVKVYNVVQQKEDVRMMDYNRLVEEKLAALVREQQGPEEDTGFRSLGEVSEEIVEIKEDPSEILEKAKLEAEGVLQNARLEADRLLYDAQKKAEAVLEEAKQEGHREGYEAGELEIRGQLQAEYQQKQQELDMHKVQLDKAYEAEMRQLEPKLLDVIVSVVEKVFCIQFDDKKEILLYLIENAISNIEGTKNYVIRVGEEQRVFLEKHKEDISDRVGHGVSLEILSDPALKNNQCIIETDSGVFDCSLGVQLENLIKDLRSLSS